MDMLTEQIAEKFGCEYAVFEKGSSPEKVEQAYMEAFADGAKNGYVPAILLCDKNMKEQLEYAYDDGSDKESLIAGCGSNGKEILNERYAEYTEDYDEEALSEYIGNEEEGESNKHFCSYISFRDNKLEEDVLLLKIPVKNPWELIGWIPVGGWNECPSPEDMIAVCKYWYEEYRAIPAVFTNDVMEFYVPSQIDASKKLEIAKEHYAFCPDRVDQGTETGTISEVAAGLPDSSVWYFWWD